MNCIIVIIGFGILVCSPRVGLSLLGQVIRYIDGFGDELELLIGCTSRIVVPGLDGARYRIKYLYTHDGYIHSRDARM